MFRLYSFFRISRVFAQGCKQRYMITSDINYRGLTHEQPAYLTLSYYNDVIVYRQQSYITTKSS